MQLYILRHGIAEDGTPGGDDAERALTAEGKKRLREVLRLAQNGGVAPELMISSPYVRAVQTAQIAREVLGYRHDLLRTEALVPSSDPEIVWEEVRIHRDCGQLMLVGHEPLLSRVAAFFLASPSLAVDMKKGAIVRIDLEEFGKLPHGVLKWMVVPKLA